MTVAHVLGLPIEESVLQLAPAGAAVVAAIAIAFRTAIGRLRGGASGHVDRTPD